MVVINKRETLQTFKFEKTGKVGIKELHFFRLALYDDNNVLHIRRRLVEKNKIVVLGFKLTGKGRRGNMFI